MQKSKTETLIQKYLSHQLNEQEFKGRLRVQAPSAEHYDELYKTRKVYAEACTFLISHLHCTEVAGTSQAAYIL